MSKKIFIKTFGCQMNEYDSNRIYDLLATIGFQKTDTKTEADCFVLNTCHIREKATEKVYHEIGRVKKDFKNLNKPLVIISGCVAQASSSPRSPATLRRRRRQGRTRTLTVWR